jgi:hypothetical protein
MFKTEIGEYKGSKTISIFVDERRVISFGVNKAKAILACFEDIKKFTESTDKNSIDLENLSEDQKKVIMQFLKN